MGFPHLADVQLLWPSLYCLHLCWKGRFLSSIFVGLKRTPGLYEFTYMNLFDSGWREDRYTYYVPSREYPFQSLG